MQAASQMVTADQQLSDKRQEQLKIQEDGKDAHEHDDLSFPILCINDVMFLPSSKFYEIVKLLSKEEQKSLQDYLIILTKNTLNQVKEEFSFKVPYIQENGNLNIESGHVKSCKSYMASVKKIEETEEIKNKIIRSRQDINDIIEYQAKKLVKKAMQDSTRTYGDYLFQLAKEEKIRLRNAILKKLQTLGFHFSPKNSKDDIIKKMCENCLIIDNNKQKINQVMSHVWQNEAIANRILMNLCVNDNKETADWNKQGVVIYKYAIDLDILLSLCKALENQTIEEVTEKYEKFLMARMKPASGSAIMPTIEEVLAEPSSKECKTVDMLCEEIKGININKNQCIRDVASTNKKKFVGKSKPLSTNRQKKGSEEAMVPLSFDDQVELLSSSQLLTIIPSISSGYKIHPRVKKWSRPPKWLFDYFQQVPENSYDGQFKDKNKDIDHIIKEKIKHDIIPIQNLLAREDEGNYFMHRGNTRTAAVIVENQGIKKYGMVDIAITADNTIYHQAVRFSGTEEVLRSQIPNYDSNKDGAEKEDNSDLYEPIGRNIVKDPLTQEYIVNIPGKSKKCKNKEFANKLTTTIHVLPYRIYA
ncbi:DUF1609 domain-containing protein [Candidatus Cardinium hertigii]|nr:DUF1609 domain-containing protein [Candidatus Cardinium hertigii]